MSNTTSERRQNLLTRDWVLVSPQRATRPWQGATEPPARQPAASHDPDCYLCPGNARAGGAHNPAYADVYVFDNDFPALVSEAGGPSASDDVLRREAEHGACRVICYGPDHSRTMAVMTISEIRAVIDAWAREYAALSARPDIAAVTIFENRGAMMGASNPHPHGQIWATSHIPNELARESDGQRAWLAAHDVPLLSDYLRRELEANERIVVANETFVALVPWWAAWPFELLILPRRPVPALPALDDAKRDGLADILSRVTRAYDRLFQAPFPYTMGFHQEPPNATPGGGFTLHAHFYPPLLRSATVRKFMVGFEMLAMPQRDITPESAAERLRACL